MSFMGVISTCARRAVVVVVPLVLTATLLPDVQAAGSQAAQSSAVVSPSTPTTGSEDATRPDRLSAMVTARASGGRVEDVSQRTETTKTYANADGSWTSEVAAEPEQVQAEQGQWHPIDTTLEERGGVLAPRYAASDLELSDGGDNTFAAVSEDARDLQWRWPTTLPAPVVEGSTATYHDVVPNGDLW